MASGDKVDSGLIKNKKNNRPVSYSAAHTHSLKIVHFVSLNTLCFLCL